MSLFPAIRFHKVALALALIVAVLGPSSCTKTTNNNDDYATQFEGTWYGSTTCGTVTSRGTTLTISSAGVLNGLYLDGITGTSGCLSVIQVYGTAESNSFTCNTQAITDSCGNADSIGFVANLNYNGTITATLISSGGYGTVCTFTGVLQ